MLFVIIILLSIVAGVSLAVNLKFFGTIKEVVSDNESLRKSLYNADNTIGKLRIGNNKLSEILKKRDRTIADMTSMMETSMDLPEEGKFDEWRNRLLRRHRQPELILASTMGPNHNDSMMMDVLTNSDRAKELKKIASPTFNFEEPEAEDPALWEKANPRYVEYTDTDVKIAKATSDVIEPQLASYLKWEKEQDDSKETPRIGTAAHENALKIIESGATLKKIPGPDTETTVMPALEPMSLEEKES